jgi:lysophospholipase L1-like esterase
MQTRRALLRSGAAIALAGAAGVLARRPALARVETPSALARPKTLACLGDSLTYSQGGADSWPSLLQTALGPSGWTVTNLGQSGDRPIDMMNRWAPVAASYGYVTVMGGINALGLGADTQFHYLRRVYDVARHYGAQVFALMMTPCKGYTGYGATEVTKAKAINAFIASCVGVVAVDTYTAFGNAGGGDADTLDPAIDSGDHGHYSSAGWARMATLLQPIILANP